MNLAKVHLVLLRNAHVSAKHTSWTGNLPSVHLAAQPNATLSRAPLAGSDREFVEVIQGIMPIPSSEDKPARHHGFRSNGGASRHQG